MNGRPVNLNQFARKGYSVIPVLQKITNKPYVHDGTDVNMLFQSASLFQSTLNLTRKWIKTQMIIFNVELQKKKKKNTNNPP